MLMPGLRGFIRKLAKKLSKKKRARLGLSSKEVVCIRYNAKGRKTVPLGYSTAHACNQAVMLNHA